MLAAQEVRPPLSARLIVLVRLLTRALLSLQACRFSRPS